MERNSSRSFGNKATAKLGGEIPRDVKQVGDEDDTGKQAARKEGREMAFNKYSV